MTEYDIIVALMIPSALGLMLLVQHIASRDTP